MSWHLDIDCSVIGYLLRFYGNYPLMKGSINQKLLAFAFFLFSYNHEIYCQNQYAIEQLPKIINSLFEEIKPITSSSGDSLFFIRSYSPENMGGEHAGEDIWLSIFTKEDGWSNATNTFGYHNKPGPDIFIGLSHGGRSLYTIDYVPSGKNRLIEIDQFDLQNPAGSEINEHPFTTIIMGDDYHDMYLNPAGNILLISMNTLNSIGLEDIYITYKNEIGEWTNPVNLGPTINSRGFEISPFLSADGQSLYFSSNGHEGMGDADIYFSERLDKDWQNWSDLVNMGSPFNSTHFDAYLFINQQNEFFLSSNRNGGYSNIYKITIQDKGFNNIDAITSEIAHADKRNKINPELVVSLSIYFDLDKSKPNSEELKKLAGFATKTKESTSQFYFEINGYTDDSGKKSYNKKLSEKRARFVYKYLKKVGFDENKLSMDGKGIFIDLNDAELMPAKKRKVDIKTSVF